MDRERVPPLRQRLAGVTLAPSFTVSETRTAATGTGARVTERSSPTGSDGGSVRAYGLPFLFCWTRLPGHSCGEFSNNLEGFF